MTLLLKLTHLGNCFFLLLLFFSFFNCTKAPSIERPARVTARILRAAAVAIRSIPDTVANIETSAARIRTVAGTANASIWRLPRTQRGNAFARWDGSDPSAINVRPFYFSSSFFFPSASSHAVRSTIGAAGVKQPNV